MIILKVYSYGHFLRSEPLVLLHLAVPVSVVGDVGDHLVHLVKSVHLAIERRDLQQPTNKNITYITIPSSEAQFYIFHWFCCKLVHLFLRHKC